MVVIVAFVVAVAPAAIIIGGCGCGGCCSCCQLIVFLIVCVWLSVFCSCSSCLCCRSDYCVVLDDEIVSRISRFLPLSMNGEYNERTYNNECSNCVE